MKGCRDTLTQERENIQCDRLRQHANWPACRGELISVESLVGLRQSGVRMLRAGSQAHCANYAEISWEKGARESPGRNLIRSPANVLSVYPFFTFLFCSCKSFDRSILAKSIYL